MRRFSFALLLAILLPAGLAPVSQAQDGPAFADFALSAASASYKATYQVSGTADGQPVSGEWTWFLRPPESRYDISIAGSGDASLYNIAAGTYLCSRVSGVTCLAMPAGQLSAQNPAAAVQSQVGSSPTNYDTSSAGSRVIAGQSAQCFVVVPAAGDTSFSEATMCFTQGAILSMCVRGNAFDLCMEATSFSSSVSDDDLRLPAPPQQLPGIPGGIPGGVPGGLPDGIPGGLPGGIPGGLPGGLPDGIPGGLPGGIPS